MYRLQDFPHGTASLLLSDHPAIIAFYYEQDITLQYGTTNVETFTDTTDHVLEAEQEIISESPPQVCVTFQHDDDEISLTLDERLDVIESDDGEP